MLRNKKYKKHSSKNAEYWDQRDWDSNEYDIEERKRQQALHSKRAAFQAIFGKVNSAISNREVPLKFSRPNGWEWNDLGDNEAPAWTDGETIFMNTRYFDQVVGESIDAKDTVSIINDLISMKGLNYHELAHVMFTPRNTQKPTSVIAKQARAEGFGLWHAYNVLEDQRIETLFSARFPIAAQYFTVTVSQFIIAVAQRKSEGHDSLRDNQQFANMHLLVHGRKYLSKKIRKSARKAFITLHSLEDAILLEGLIDEYRKLAFPRDAKRAVEIVNEFHNWILAQRQKLLDTNQGHYQPEDLVPNVSAGHEHQRNNSSDGAVAQREAVELVEEKESQEDSFEYDHEDSNTGTDAGDDSDESGDPDSTGSQESTSGEGSPSDSDEQGSGSGGSLLEDLTEQARSLLDEAVNQSLEAKRDVQKDVIETIKSVNNHDKYEDRGISYKAKEEDKVIPSTTVKMGSRHLGSSLDQLIFDAEPTWVKRIDRGRINVQAAMESYMSGSMSLDIFDEWKDDGDDATSIEVVILLDQSTSMSGDNLIGEASMALWAIKNACDIRDIPCHAVGFSVDAVTLYDGNTPVGPKAAIFPTIGGTKVMGALAKADAIFRASDKKHKLLFTLTDGEFHDDERAVAVQMQMLHEIGVRSHLVYILSERESLSVAENDQRKADTVERLRNLYGDPNCSHQQATVAVGVGPASKALKDDLLQVVQEAAANAIV